MRLFVQIGGCVFHVAYGVVDVALCLVELALGLKFLVISELAGRFLDAALCFVGSALHMFAVHHESPSNHCLINAGDSWTFRFHHAAAPPNPPSWTTPFTVKSPVQVS